MKKQFLLPAIGFVVFANLLLSCTKKDNDSVTPALQSCRILSETDHESGDSAVYVYNDAGKLIRIQGYDDKGDSSAYETYVYETGKIIHTFYNADKTFDARQEFFLNANGTAAREIRTGNDPNGTIGDTLFYTYDNEGYNTLVVDKSYYGGKSPSTTIDSTWNTFTNGDNTYSIRRVYYSANIKTEEYINRMTYTTEESKNSFFYGEVPGQYFYGKGNTHLLATSTDQDETYLETFTFKLTNNLITGMKIVFTDKDYPQNNSIVDYAYTYDCK